MHNDHGNVTLRPAGSLFDSDLVLAELPTVLTGAVSLIVLKGLTVAAATRVPRWLEPNRLDPYDAVKLSFLLSGGGEFAFVVLALAEKLEVLPQDLGGLLTAIVLITMAVTPLLGQAADVASEAYLSYTVSMNTDKARKKQKSSAEQSQVAEDAVVVCGYGAIGKEIVNKLSDAESNTAQLSLLPQVVVFDTKPSLIDNILMPASNVAVMYGDGENPEVFKSHGVNNPRAIFISYKHHEQVMAATSRLRPFFVETPIYTRAQSRREAQELMSAGATEVVVEMDELPRSSPYFLLGGQQRQVNKDGEDDIDDTSIPILNVVDATERN